MSSAVLIHRLASLWVTSGETDDRLGDPHRARTGGNGPVVPVDNQGLCEANMSKGQGGGSKSGGKGGGGAPRSGGGQQGAGWPSKTGQPSGGGRDNAAPKK